MSDDTRILKIPFVNVYPAYIQKAERKGRTKEEVDEIIFCITGNRYFFTVGHSYR
jgi:hypothetical protein